MKTLSLRCSLCTHFMMPASMVWAAWAVLPAAQAQSGTWTNFAANGLWSTPANWAGGIPADASGSTADFSTLELTADRTVALDTPRVLTALTFGDLDPLTPASWILTDNGDPLNILTLDTTPTITVNALGTGAAVTVSAGIGGAAGLAKAGAGQLNLTGNNSYTGATNVNGGILSLNAGGVINGGGVSSSTAAGSQFVVNGGTLTSSALSTFNQTGNGFLMNSGSAVFNGGVRTANSDGSIIQIAGGSFTATSVELRRTRSYTALLTNTDANMGGLYVTGGTVNLTTLNIGTSNSSSSARIDGGDVIVSGNINIGGTTNTRYSVLQVKGGTFTSTDLVNGVVLGTHTATGNNTELYLTGGTATVEKISMGASTLVTGGSGTVYLNGGSLYIGSGGVEKRAVGTYVPGISLIAGTLGAKANWTTDVNLTTGTVAANNAVIKSADASGAPFDIRLNGVISGSNGFSKEGAGTLILAGNNTYDGSGGMGTVISAGTLQVGAGGTSGTLGLGPVTNHASLVFNRSDALTVDNVITGTGTLTKQGNGTLILTGDNAFSGTLLSGGTLSLANTAGSATGSGPVTVQAGGTLGGTGTAGGAVTVSSGGHIAPGTGVGTLQTGSLTLGAGSELDFEFNGTPANDRIEVAGTLTLNGGAVRLRQENSPNPWSSLAKYYLIKYGSLSGTGIASLSVANPVSGVTYTFGTETVGADKFVILTLSSAGTPHTWNVNASGNWGDAANWSTGIPGGAGNPVNFLGAISTARTVTLDTPRTAGSLNFDNGNSYTLAGAALTFNNGASPASASSLNGVHHLNPDVVLPAAGLNTSSSLADASLEFAGVVSGPGPVRHQGPGLVRMTGANTFGGGTTLTGNGTVEIGHGSSLGTGGFSWSGNGTLRPLSGITLANPATIATGVNGTIDTAGWDFTVSGIISGAGALVKSGVGVLTLSNTNAYTGGTRLLGGEAGFTSLANLGSGGLTFDGGGLLWGPGNTTDISVRPVALLAGGGSLNTGANSITLAAAVGESGPGTLTKLGSGTLTLAAANTYTGPTRIFEGTLTVSAAENLGPAPAAVASQQLALDGGTFLPVSSFDLPPTTGLAVGPAKGTVNLPAGVVLGVGAGISDRDANPGILNLAGEGSLTLTTNSTWSGGGTFQAVTVNVNASNALGSGPLVLEGTTLNTAGGVLLPNALIVDGTAVINLSSASPGSTLAGALTGSGTLTVNTSGSRSQVSGNWTGFTGQLNLDGGGEWRIAGFDETFTNAKVNIAGTTNLVLAVNPNVGVPRIIRIGQLTGTGLLGGQPVPGRFVNWVVGGLNTDSTFEGIIKDNMSQPNGTGNAASQFTKEGAGTLTLTGNSTYTDITTVNNGTLLINGDNSAATGALTVNTGTLGGTGIVGAPVTVQAGGFLAPGVGIGTLTTGSTLLEGTLTIGYNQADPSLIDKLAVNGDLTLGPASNLVLEAAGGAFPAGGVHLIATYSGTLTGTFGSITGLPAGYQINYAYNDGVSSNNIALVSSFSSPAYDAWAVARGLTGADAAASSDPDKDGRINLLEFALNGDPGSAADAGKARPAVIAAGPDQVFSLTLPVRNGAVFSGTAAQTASIDGIAYRVEGSVELADWGTVVVSEVVPAAAAGLPALEAGWSYRTFRTEGAVNAGLRDWLRVRVSPAN